MSLITPDASHSVQLDIEGMTCASCAGRVEKGLNDLPGVTATVNYATEQATVWAEAPDLEKLVAQVEKTGYRARSSSESTGPRPDRVAELRRRVILSALFTVPVVVLSMVPPLQFPGWQWVVAALALPVAAWAAWPFHRSAWVNAKHRAATMDTLVSIGVLAAMGWSFYALFFGGAGVIGMTMQMHLFAPPSEVGNEVYFEVAAAVTTFILLGRYLETRAKRDAGAALQALLRAGAHEARVLREVPGPDGPISLEQVVPIDQLAVGAMCVVRPGDRIPTDGIVREGQSAIDRSVVTGESVPVEVEPGDSVIGGTINAHGRLVVEATRVGADTHLARMATIVERAQNGKARSQRLADSISGVFVPIVMVLSVLTLAGWLIWGPSAEWAFRAAVATLIIACPCALGLATPTALLAGTGRGAELGILLSGPEALEQSRHVDIVAMDKTGTLTTGQMTVVGTAVHGVSEDELWNTLLAVEQSSSHPIAEALRRERPGAVVGTVTESRAHAGFGVSAVHDGKRVWAGRQSWLVQQGQAVPDELADQVDTETQAGYTGVWLAVEGVVWGAVFLSDEPKDTALATVNALRHQGVQVVLLTGDSQGAASRVAELLGIETVIAEVTPEGKVEAVSALQAQGHRVAMVGDGINDAPALATAHVGIALGSGTDQAMSAGDITITRGDIDQVPTALLLARKTLNTIRGNLFWAFAYNVIALPLAMAGVLNPLIAGAAMAFSSVFVVSNSLRLRGFRATSARTSPVQTPRD